MKKITMELIVPDDYGIEDMHDLISIGSKNAVFPKGDNNDLFKLDPQIVTVSPFNKNYLTLVLNEEQLDEAAIERFRNKR